jgi:hypothetical protein
MNSSNSPNSLLSTLEQTMQSIQEDFKIKYESDIAYVVNLVRQEIQQTIRKVNKKTPRNLYNAVEVEIHFNKNVENQDVICKEVCKVLQQEFFEVETFIWQGLRFFCVSL